MDTYIEENRSFVTASKLKCFLKSPENYFLKYIKEKAPLVDKEKKAFALGTAIDDYISYGKEAFDKKYFIDEGMKVEDMRTKLLVLYSIEELKGLKKPELENLLYGDMSQRVKLTPGDSATVLGCVNELLRQPLFQKDGGYICQKTFTGSFGTLKLKGTLDRYKPGEIRDTKSTKSLKSFKWEWDKDLAYDLSMAFYWVLVNKATGDKPRLIFDTVQKTFPYPSKIYQIPDGKILPIINDVIIPALKTLDSMMIAWEETKNEDLWKIRGEDLTECEFYPIMESALHTEIEFLQ